jgi:ribose 5-phosphate isomerase B
MLLLRAVLVALLLVGSAPRALAGDRVPLWKRASSCMIRWGGKVRALWPRRPDARTVPIGSDHAGFALKEQLKSELTRLGYQPLDVGTHQGADVSVDYPDFAHRVARLVSRGKVERGVLVCGTGIGMSMVANRHRNVRAAVVWKPEIAEVTRRHNNANLLTLPARHLSGEEARSILRTFLSTPFDGGRHQRRIEKIER